jgi:hypothetical protein
MPYPPGATLDLNFATSLPAGMTFARASTATDSHWTDAPGSSYNTYGNDVPRFHPFGMVFESAAHTNYLLNNTSPATQTVTLTNTWACVLWVIGTGSATVTAGTGAATGLGTAVAGTPLYFTVTTSGTFVVTVNGSLDRFQLERGGSPTSFIPTAGASATRQAETCYQATGGWYNTTAGTLVGGASFLTMTGVNNQGIIELSDGTTQNRFLVSQTATGAQAAITTGNVAQINSQLAPPFVAGRIYSVALRYTAAGNCRGATVGLLMPDNNGKSMPTVTRIDLPLGAVGAPGLGATWIMNRGLYYPWAFADYELQCATAGNAMAGTAIFM